MLEAWLEYLAVSGFCLGYLYLNKCSVLFHCTTEQQLEAFNLVINVHDVKPEVLL